MTTDDLLAAAQAHHRAGAIDQAAALYDTVLAERPDQPDALHLSALIALRRGDTSVAVDRLARAAAAPGASAVVHSDHGAALRLAGRLDEAAAAVERAVSLDPDYGDAWNNLGFVRRALGDHAGARAALERAAALKPDFAPTHNALGVVLGALGERAAAVPCFERAIRLNPDYVEALSNLGLALLEQDRPRAALEPLQRAVARAAQVGEAWLNLGLAHRALGDLPAAVAALQRAVALKPTLTEAWTALGVVLELSGDSSASADAFKRAVELAPRSVDALSNYALALHQLKRHAEALALFDRALTASPAHGDALSNRGVVRQALGDFAGAMADWRAAVAADPGQRLARSNILMSLHYDADLDGAALCALAREYGRVHGHPAGQFKAWPNPRVPDRRLRVGYVSGDFREHSVAHYLEPLLAAHDRTAFEIFAYADVRRPDAVTARLKQQVDCWRAIAAVADGEVVRRIREDGIDILVDLSGHTARNRLGVFAHKPAPVQLAWLGYPGTTGLSAIGHRLTDAIADPPGSEPHATEALVRLRRGFHCWRPPPEAPQIAPLPGGQIAFGSFNNVQKIAPPAIEAWAGILRGVPDSRLVLKSNWLSRPIVAAALRDAFAAHGIDPARLELSPWIESTRAHLDAYGAIAVALDPFPYNGTTTTLEALWMGVPVVTLRGQRHSGRVGASLLSQAGLDDLIAATPAAYVARAIELARRRDALSLYRATLRARLSASPLMDAAGFARDLEAAYRDLWRRWCETGP